MSYNFQENQDTYLYPAQEENTFPEESPYGSIEDFSEQEFEAVGKIGEVDAQKVEASDGFYRNLALEMEENQLISLAAELLEEVDDQLRMREEWEQGIATAEKYLGRRIEESTDDEGARAWRSKVYDTTLSTALYRIYSMYKRALFPPGGPCKSEIEGVPTKEIVEKAERRRMFANYALTVEDKGYYPDSDDMLFMTIFCGSTFRKVFMDPLTGKPKARYVKPQDFICDLNCTSLLASMSLGYVFKQTKRDIVQLQETGKYVKFTLGMPSDSMKQESVIDKTAQQEEGIEPNQLENKNLYDVHERHVYLTSDKLKGADEFASNEDRLYPYRITILDKKVVEIIRNWKEDDEIYTRIEHFTHNKFLPGMGGLYGVGIAHLGASNAITLTTILRQMIDKLALNTFPGGIKSTMFRSEDNIIAPKPGQWIDVETMGLPIDQGYREMPYPPPSPLFFDIFKNVQENTYVQLGVADTGVPENSAQTPVGTTLAALEVANQLPSASLSSFHTSLRQEFELLFGLWAECLPDEPYPFKVPGYEGAIMRSDFEDNINTVPVSDPNVLTSTHRLVQADGLASIAAASPDLYNLKEVERRRLEALGIENIDEILVQDPEPQSLDAVTENMLLAQGEPIMVSPDQNHPAHNTVHNVFLTQLENNPELRGIVLQANPMAIFQLTMHIQNHSANELMNEIRNGNPEMGIPPNPEAYKDIEPTEYLTIPYIQNRLTAMNADEAINQMEESQAAAAQEAENAMLPQKVMMADIEQRREAEQIRAETAIRKIENEKQISDQKTEADTFTSQLKFESDINKVEAEKEMAKEKNEVDLATEQMKHNVIPGE